jgi:hypothetical protein
MTAFPPPPERARRRRMPWLWWAVGGIAVLLVPAVTLAGLATSSGADVRSGVGAASPAVAASEGRDDVEVSPSDPMGEGGSCRDKLAAQLPTALAHYGLDPQLDSVELLGGIHSICRQGPPSTTIRKGAQWAVVCAGLLWQDAKVVRVEES